MLLPNATVYITNRFYLHGDKAEKKNSALNTKCALAVSSFWLAALQQPFHSQWNAVPGEHLSRRRPAALGGEARPVAEETQARWCHQQSTYGFLPKGVEDPAEVPRSVHRRIRVTLFYHKRGRYSQTCCRFGLPAYVCV